MNKKQRKQKQIDDAKQLDGAEKIDAYLHTLANAPPAQEPDRSSMNRDDNKKVPPPEEDSAEREEPNPYIIFDEEQRLKKLAEENAKLRAQESEKRAAYMCHVRICPKKANFADKRALVWIATKRVYYFCDYHYGEVRKQKHIWRLPREGEL